MYPPTGPRGDLLSEHTANVQAADTAKPPDVVDQAEIDRKKKIVDMVIRNFKIASNAEQAQRDREMEDLKFDRALPEDQWPESIRKARGGDIGPDGHVVSERPCLVIPKLDQPVQQVVNEARNARIGVRIKPKGEGANIETAEVKQGLYRTIEQNSRAQVVRIGAFERAVKCGRGFYRILKTYANDGDFDLDIVISRILNQGSVFLDPYAQEPDWSDGEWAIIVNDLPVDEYNRRYPNSRVANFSADDLVATLAKAPGWIGGTDDDNRTIRVAEFYYIIHKERIRVFLPDQGYLWEDELPVEMPEARRRSVDTKKVKWCVVNAEEVLDEEDWGGRYIPIIPVIGKEYNIDGERCFKGLISNSKDAQRSYNYMRSAQVEAVGLAPKAPYVMAEGQDEGYEAMWDQLNTKNYTRLKYKPVDFMGATLPPPQRNVAEPAIQAISMAVNMADNDIKATTGRFDPSLGRARADQSGKAINLLKESGESTTSNYLENLTSISMNYEARVILDLMPIVYDRRGRIIRVLGEEEQQDKDVMINQPMVQGPQGPMAAPPPPPPGMQPPMPQPGMQPGMPPPPAQPGMMPPQGGMPPPMAKPPKPPKLYDLTKGEYGIEITVGKSFPTQRDENADMLRGLIEAAPGLTPLLADLLVENMDTPIAKRAAQRLRKANPSLQDEDDEQDIPPAAKAQMQAMGEQNQQLTEALKLATEEIEKQKYKVDAETHTKQIEIQSRQEIAQLQASSSLQETQLKINAELEIARMKIQGDLQEQQNEQQHDQTMAVGEAKLAARERADEHGHERELKGAELRSKDNQQARDLQVTQAENDKDRQVTQAESDRDRKASQVEQARDLTASDISEERELAAKQQEQKRDQSHEVGIKAADAKHTSREADEDRKLAKEQTKAKAKPKEKS